jgi:hypothetical protein
MNTFFLDLWQDLRAKRLWPVAVALLAATVAVPVLLSKPAETPAPSTGATQASNTDKLPTVALDASSVAGSHLNVFDEKNPFSALSDPAATTSATDTGSTGSGATLPTGGGLPGTSGSTTGTGSTGTGSSSGGTSGSGTGTQPPVGPDGKPVEPGVHYFAYSADVRFGTRGHLKTYKAIHDLDLLPSGESPIVAFMGVKDGDTAVFFIADPAFRADGEGECVPDADNCMFLYLKKDADKNEETLSAQNGQIEYVLELTGLHVETVDQSKVVGDTTPSAKKARPRKLDATLLSLPSVVAKR